MGFGLGLVHDWFFALFPFTLALTDLWVCSEWAFFAVIPFTLALTDLWVCSWWPRLMYVNIYNYSEYP